MIFRVVNKKIFYLLLSLLTFIPLRDLCSQKVDSSSFSIYSRLTFYSYEKDGEFLLHIPKKLIYSPLSVTIVSGEKIIASWKGRSGKPLLRIPFSIDMQPSDYAVTARISTVGGAGQVYTATSDLLILTHKPNEVKSDRFTGGIIVNRRPFFPFGFYCYSPVSPTLPEEEIVKGFNMISPYQTILPETLGERKAYMDRCAEVGMKVHYNLLSLTGGGGVDSKTGPMSSQEKTTMLIKEIRTFMNHPALLAWYISDEPNGYKIPPDSLIKLYRIVKDTDPWHPVSMVFMAPFLSAKEYAGALDIVMADPYPVPDYPISMTGNVAGQLTGEFAGKRSVWMVLQAFGGGEWWGREPTLQELRSMTWQSIVKGATGIQYFVRQGLNYFPKSVAAWNECGRMAMEVAEITPWLLSDEETMPVESSTGNIIVSSRRHNGQLLVMAVNKINQPLPVTIWIRGMGSSTARVIFENRSLPVSTGKINDNIAPFGSQVYLINTRLPKTISESFRENLLKDPGFEEISTTGVPSACYARPGGDRGATYFLDSREHHEGNHSIRLFTPGEGKGITLRLFPFRVKAGSSYAISVWAKSDPEQRLSYVTNSDSARLYPINEIKQYVEISLGSFGKARFEPDAEWRRYMAFVSVPVDTLQSFRTNMTIKMTGQGVAWIDDMKVFEEKP